MNSFPKTSVKSKSIWFLLLSIIFSISCGNQTESNTNGKANSNTADIANNKNASTSNDDVAALANQVLLPIVPEEVAFREENVKNSDHKKLTAVMKFTEEEAKNLVAQAEKHRPAEAVEIDTEQWFPAELIAQAQLSGNESLKGSAFAPTDFLQLPYKNGRLIKIENSNYFILELSTN